jgi:beta-mannosidase
VRPPGTDLSGTWRAAPADDDLRREYHAVGFDDDGWEALEVPGHWRSTPAFADQDGPVLHRTRFSSPRIERATATDADGVHELQTADGERGWLVLDGVFYQGDVWMDAAYVGATEGYFFHHTFEVTDLLTDREEHELAVEVTCARPGDLTAKRNITGVFQHWDNFDPSWNPGGIWRPVRLERTGPVRLRRLHVVCTEATPVRAVLECHAVLDATEAGSAQVRTTVGDGVEHVAEHAIAAGENQVEWVVRIDDPELWWPWALGDQPLQDVAIEVRPTTGPGSEPDAEPSHRVTRRVGLRSVELDDWVLHVNGERLFVKGSNQGPTRMALAEATPEELAADVHLAKEAGLDLLRLHAHVSRPELYEAADEAGLLLWQDLPLQWGYARGIRKQAVRQARKAIEAVGHHASVVLWCAHNEPMAIDVTPQVFGDRKKLGRALVRGALAQQLPTWNKTVLDGSLARALRKGDSSRPVVPHSGVLPHLPLLDGTDSHLYFGWYHGAERTLPRFAAAIPRLVRWVSEFGAQAVPDTADFMHAERWPDLDWDDLGEHHALQKLFFDQRVPPADFPTFDAWREATQRYQADLIKHHVEALRRLKYRPTGGFCHFCFADGHPAVTWSVLDHERRPKLGHAALAAACRPVIVVLERPPATVAPGQRLELDVHVVSDRRDDLVAARTTLDVSWDGGSQQLGWAGDVPADDCVKVGTLRLTVPDVDGPLTFALALEHDGGPVTTNAYEATISR